MAKLIPNHFDVVTRLKQQLKPILSTKEGCGAFTEAVTIELNKIDPEFGHLIKKGGQNQYNGHAVDAILYKKAGRTVDIIGSSETAKADIRWGENEADKYTEKDWLAPSGNNPNPNPIPNPTPDSDIDKLKAENEALKVEVAELKKSSGRVIKTTYHDFVSKEFMEYQQAYFNKHNNMPAISDLAHLAWRRLVENMEHVDIVRNV